VNDRDVLVPMVIEEPSVVAAASHAARLAREAGGFRAEADEAVMIGQVQVVDVPDIEQARQAVLEAKADLVAAGNRPDSTLVRLGGGIRGVEARVLPETRLGAMLIVHLLVDVRDAMGANAVNTACEAIAPAVERLTGGRAVLRILSNLADRRLARASCRVPLAALRHDRLDGADVARGIMEAQAFAEADAYRAATHNKGILNGVDAVALATGNDWRSVEAGAHAYAAREGRYRPLTDWWLDARGDLVGQIELPLALGIVGGTTRAHPLAQVALKLLGVSSARELAAVVAAVGLAQNLGALRALAAEGIQQGHMKLHARKQSAVSDRR
jgi:hydroxymethylglutaryl-CoA reductase